MFSARPLAVARKLRAEFDRGSKDLLRPDPAAPLHFVPAYVRPLAFVYL